MRKGITPDSLRRLYSGDEVVLIQVWNQVGTSLDKLDVSKSDTFQGAIFALFSAGFVSCAPRLRAGDG